MYSPKRNGAIAPVITALRSSLLAVAALAVTATMLIGASQAMAGSGGIGTDPTRGGGNDSGKCRGKARLLSNGNAAAPGCAPKRVKRAIAAANKINHTKYQWGGGHGSFNSRGYDCSGAVSFMLHGAGVLSTPLDSGQPCRLGRQAEGQVDHDLRELRPRLRHRRRPPLGHLGRPRPPLAQGRTLERGLHGPPPRRPLSPASHPPVPLAALGVRQGVGREGDQRASPITRRSRARWAPSRPTPGLCDRP